MEMLYIMDSDPVAVPMLQDMRHCRLTQSSPQTDPKQPWDHTLSVPDSMVNSTLGDLTQRVKGIIISHPHKILLLLMENIYKVKRSVQILMN